MISWWRTICTSQRGVSAPGGEDHRERGPFVKAELCDEAQVEALFAQHPDIEAVITRRTEGSRGEVAKP